MGRPADLVSLQRRLAGQPAACLALAQRGERVIVQRNVHASTIDGLVLAGLQPTWVAPELDPELGLAHCLTPAALDWRWPPRPAPRR